MDSAYLAHTEHLHGNWRLEKEYIAFLHLIIDPACSIVYEVEPAEADAMNRPPRDPPKEPLFSKRVLLNTLQGLSVLAMLLTIFGVCLARGQGELDARTLAFMTLIIANLGLMMTNLSGPALLARSTGLPMRHSGG